MKKLIITCAVAVTILAMVCQCDAGIIVGNPETPITVNVIDASYKSKNVGATLIDLAGNWGKVGIYAMGWYENQGGSTYAAVVVLSVQSVLDGSGNGIGAAFVGDFATNFGESAVIDGSLNFQDDNADRSNLTYYDYYRDSSNYKYYTRTGNFRSGSTATGISGYVGLELTNNGQTYYGWMHLTVITPDSWTGAKVTIDNWAWNNTPDAQIATGAIPEPATMALLSLGGLLLRRKK